MFGCSHTLMIYRRSLQTEPSVAIGVRFEREQRYSASSCCLMLAARHFRKTALDEASHRPSDQEDC